MTKNCLTTKTQTHAHLPTYTTTRTLTHTHFTVVETQMKLNMPEGRLRVGPLACSSTQCSQHHRPGTRAAVNQSFGTAATWNFITLASRISEAFSGDWDKHRCASPQLAHVLKLALCLKVGTNVANGE